MVKDMKVALVFGRESNVGYTNHRGEKSRRRIRPTSLWYGTTEWHPTPQWLLEAHDLDKDEHRTFALKDMTP